MKTFILIPGDCFKMKRKSGKIDYFFGINVFLILMITISAYFFSLPAYLAGALILFMFFISFLLIVKFLDEPLYKTAESTVPDGKRGNVKIKKELQKLIEVLRKEKEEFQKTIDSQKNEIKKAKEKLMEADRTLNSLSSIVPLTIKYLREDNSLCSLEAGISQIELTVKERFKPTKSGISLEENILFIHSMLLYRLIHKLSDLDESQKISLLRKRCTELTNALDNVRLVNYNLNTTYNPNSHQCIDGSPAPDETVHVHSFKIENVHTGGTLRKALVSTERQFL